MAIINKQLIESLGIELSARDMESLADHFETTLDSRVADEISKELNVDQLGQLNQMRESGSDEELGLWLKENVPDLKEIIDDETAILLGELADGADKI